MNAEIKKLWVDALRSGNYFQTFFEFKQVSSLDHKTCHCTAGVLMDIYEKVVQKIENWDTIPLEVLEWAGLETATEDNPFDIGDIFEMNDNYKPFTLIADFIEAHF